MARSKMVIKNSISFFLNIKILNYFNSSASFTELYALAYKSPRFDIIFENVYLLFLDWNSIISCINWTNIKSWSKWYYVR